MKMVKSVAGMVAGALLAGAAAAAEITVLSAGAMQPGLISVAEPFRRQSGHAIKVTYATAPELRRRVGGGEVADVLLAPPAVVRELTQDGRVGAEGQIPVGRVGAGVVARNGAPLPDISTAEALRRSLLEADSVVYNRASSGIYIETMLKKMGLFEQLEPKLKRYPDGTAVMHHLMKGTGREFGFGGVTDILMYRGKGLQLVGPLPAEVQNYTSYAAALITAATSPAAGREFIRYLGSPQGRALFVESGIQQPQPGGTNP
jgi:molybdate transport system substrate-binding protein